MIICHPTGLGITPLTANAWGMGIGALTLLPVIISSGQTLTAPQDKSYWLALIYLSVAASIIAFTTYLSLVARLGSAKAGYATVLFPVVALSASTVFEGYVWTATSIAGASLAVLGNVVMFYRPLGRPRFRAAIGIRNR